MVLPAFPHPPVRPGSGRQYTLYDILACNLTQFPKPRNQTIASSTSDRAAKIFRIKYKEEERIRGVIFCPTLLDRSIFLVSEKATQIKFNEARFHDVSFINYISPFLSLSYCTPELSSENDTRQYINDGLIRPALAAMDLITLKEVPTDFDCTRCSSDCYVTSGSKVGKSGPIPDYFLVQGPYVPPQAKASFPSQVEKCVVVEVDYDDDDFVDEQLVEEHLVVEEPEDGEAVSCKKILMTIEAKTSNAFTPLVFEEVMLLKGTRGFKDSLVIRFDWPKVGTVFIRKSTKVIAQLSEQMVFHNVEYALLSSCDKNIFFFLDKVTRILYMSDQDSYNTPLAVLSWFYRARGLIDEELIVPEPDYTYYGEVDPLRRDGIMAIPLRDALDRENLQTPTKQTHRRELSRSSDYVSLEEDSEDLFGPIQETSIIEERQTPRKQYQKIELSHSPENDNSEEDSGELFASLQDASIMENQQTPTKQTHKRKLSYSSDNDNLEGDLESEMNETPKPINLRKCLEKKRKQYRSPSPST